MIKKILIFTASMLPSANILCDDGWLDIYNETGETIFVKASQSPYGDQNSAAITEEFKMEKGGPKRPFKINFPYNATRKSGSSGTQSDMITTARSLLPIPETCNAIVEWTTPDNKKYETRILDRPNSIYLRKNGEYLTWDHKDSLFPTEHKEKAQQQLK